MASLRILSGPQELAPFDIAETNTTIGRSKATVCRLEHRSVSKYHALIVADEDKHVLFDLDSTNGTFLNNQRVSSAPLRHGDHVRLGEFVIAYENEAQQPAAAAAEPATALAAPKLAADQPLRRRPTLQREPAAGISATPPLPPSPVPPAPQKATADVPMTAKAPASATPPGEAGKAFIRLPGEKKASGGLRATGVAAKALRREPAAEQAEPAPPQATPQPKIATPPPAPAPAPQPVAPPQTAETPIASTPSAPSEEKILQKPVAEAEQAGRIVLKTGGAGGESAGNKILLRPPAKKRGEITLKRPGAPKPE